MRYLYRRKFPFVLLSLELELALSEWTEIPMDYRNRSSSKPRWWCSIILPHKKLEAHSFLV